MRAEIILARHAAHEDLGRRLTGRAAGVNLSAFGRRQADALGRVLAARRPSVLQCSPRERARQTAEAISRHTGLEPMVEPALDEIDFGAWNGAAFADLEPDPLWRRWNEARDAGAPPEGEAMADAVTRMASHIEGLAGGPGAIVMVTHCDVIRGVVAHYLGLPMQAIFRFEVAPASITTLRVEDGRVTLVNLNVRIDDE